MSESDHLAERVRAALVTATLAAYEDAAVPGSPESLYAMYLDAAQHAAFTGGGQASIAAAADTDWSASGGRIHGRILALIPGRRIVQSWRGFEWRDDEADTILILRFSPADAGARVDLAHTDAPERLYATLMDGWRSRYWEPWRPI